MFKVKVKTATYQSPIGALTFTSGGEKLFGLWIKGQKYCGDTVLEEMIEKSDIPIFKKMKNGLTNILKVKSLSFQNYR